MSPCLHKKWPQLGSWYWAAVMYDLALSQPQLGSMGERECVYTHTHMYIYTLEYYSVIKRMTFVAMWKDLKGVMLCEISWRTNTV